MKMSSIQRGLFALLTVIFTLATASQTFAAAPVFRTVEISRQGAATGCDFPVAIRLTATLKTSIHTDADGSFKMRIDRFIGGEVSFVNLDTGASVMSTSAGINKITLEQDGSLALSITGLIDAITLPGEGVVLRDVGRLVFDAQTGDVTFEAGAHNAALTNDVAPLCAELS